MNLSQDIDSNFSPAVNSVSDSSHAAQSALLATSAASLLAACGGGDAGPNGAVAVAEPQATARAVAAPGSDISDQDAARFLMQASLGASRAQMAQVQNLGYAGWLNWQFSSAATKPRWATMKSLASTYGATKASVDAFDQVAWKRLVTTDDSDDLRQRVALALSEILVVGIPGLSGNWIDYQAAAYMDLLDAKAFSNYRDILQAVSTSLPMAVYLTFIDNVKADPATDSEPDENYARELMQLFTIGLVKLNLDGSPVLVNGATVPTYTLSDVLGLARVFTGWVANDTSNQAKPDYTNLPLVQNAANCETGEKAFLGVTIPAGTDGVGSLKIALDTLFAHPNVAPFISQQLIMRLVTSNPSPAYVARVATVFNDDGSGVKGNMKAVISAILLDNEARDRVIASQPGYGKLREPIFRFLAWARAYRNTSFSAYTLSGSVNDTSDQATSLGQSPLRSPTVFNFFQPDYAPPGVIADGGLVAPEFEITNETSIVGYLNYMQKAIGVLSVNYISYAGLLSGGSAALAANPAALVAEFNTVLAAGQLTPSTVATVVNAVNSTSGTTARIRCGLMLVLACAEFMVQQ